MAHFLRKISYDCAIINREKSGICHINMNNSTEQGAQCLLDLAHRSDADVVSGGINTLHVVRRNDDVGKAQFLCLADALVDATHGAHFTPTSPAMHHPCSIGVSTLLDSTAAMTLRSMARSVTLRPPAILTNTSF